MLGTHSLISLAVPMVLAGKREIQYLALPENSAIEIHTGIICKNKSPLKMIELPIIHQRVDYSIHAKISKVSS